MEGLWWGGGRVGLGGMLGHSVGQCKEEKAKAAYRK